MGEILAFGIIAAGFLLICGLPRMAGRILAATIAFAFLLGFFDAWSAGPVSGSAHEAIAGLFRSAELPQWVYVVAGGIIGLWILQAVLSVLFGRKVADTAVGTIVAQAVVAIGKLGVWPFRWLRRVLDLIKRGNSTD